MNAISLHLPPAEAGGEPVDLVDVADALAADRDALRGARLAVLGLQDLGADRDDINAVNELLLALDGRLKQRAAQLAELAARLDPPDDADAPLVQAWRDWQAAIRAYLDAPDWAKEPDDGPLYRATINAETKIAELPAATVLGLAVKLKYLVSEFGDGTERALAYDLPMPPDVLKDQPTERLWHAAGIAERLAGRCL